MSKAKFSILIGLIFLMGCVIYMPRPYEGEPYPDEAEYYEDEYYENDISYFYDHLSPHGIWARHSRHGYVWIPYMTRVGWRPYTHGRWVWTDFGWTWISEYKWGWIPFHYGRWGWDDYLGWYWVSGTQWGPAWVTWRRGRTYVGWAPLPPDVRFVAGVGITSLPYDLPGYHWIFVEGRDFYSPHVSRYILPRERNLTIINYTSVKTSIVMRDRRVINNGIDVDYMRRVSRQRISKYQLEDSRAEGPSRIRAESVEVHRPRIRQDSSVKPKSVVNREDAKARITKERIKRSSEETDAPRREEVKRIHEREERLLNESQDREKRDLKKQYDSKKRLVRSDEEVVKTEEEYKKKRVRLKEKHEDEKAKITKRHKDEKEKAKKTKVKKTEVKK